MARLKSHLALAILVCVGPIACSTQTQWTPTSEFVRTNSYTTQVREQAVFDLHCPLEKLSFQEVGGGSGMVPNIGVDGCGQRAKYVWGTAGYVLNMARTTE